MGGTSLASPLMSGILAIANQVRVSNGLQTLDSTPQTQTLPMLYSVPQDSYFHDITTGISNNVDQFGDNEGNGFAASPGYDIASGLGSPIANNLINYLGGNSTSPPPTVSAPADATMLEGGIFNWDDVISVNDAQLPGTTQQVTLTADEGTIQLSLTNNVSISAGANNSSSMTISGTLANLNTVLGNVMYLAPNGYVGSDYIQISVNDGTDSNTGSGVIDMTIVPTSAARIFAGLPVSTPENQAYNFGPGISLTDPDASGASESLSLTVDNGTLMLASTTGLTFTAGSNNAKTMTIQGTLAALQNAVFNATSGGIWYTPNSNFVGQDWLQLSFMNILDGMPDPSFTSISVLGAPTVSAPRNVQVIENASYVFSNSAFTLSDNAASGTSDSLQLSVADGSIDLGSTTGLTFTQGGNGSSVMTFGGTLANLQAALQGLTYVPGSNYLGTDTLSLTLSDSGDKLSSPKTSVGLSVVAQPTLTGVSNVTVSENGTYTFSSGQLALGDASATGTSNTLSLKVGDGKLTLGSTTGLTITSGSNGGSSMTVAGSIANLAAALNGLVYTPTTNWSGSDQLSLSYKDSSDSLTASSAVSIDVTTVQPPEITSPTSVTTNENAAYTFPGTISFTDTAAGANGTDSFTLSVAHGTLALGATNGTTITAGANDSSSMTVTGTVTSLNAALDGLVYTPTLNYASGDTLSIAVKDLTFSVTQNASVAIVFNPAPSIVAPSSIDVNENSSYTFPNGTILLGDTAASGTSDTLTLSVSDGTLSLASTTGLTFGGGTSNNASSIIVTGTLANLSAAVNGLEYTPAPSFASGDTLQFTLSDSGDSLTGNDSVAITVGNFPPPTVKVPSASSTNENSTVNFASAISVTDTIASGTSDSISLSVANGKLTLGSTSGLTFNAGANGSSSMTVTGTLTNLNAALTGLVYAPITGFSGHDSLQISASDATDNQVGSGSVAIAVDPFAAAPATATVLENGSYAFSTSAKDAISLTDGAATATTDTMTLTVLEGKLTLATTTGLTITGGANGSSSITVKGSLTNLNAALNGLVYAPTSFYKGDDTLTVSVSDAGDGLSGSTKVDITVTFKQISPAISIAGSDAGSLDDQSNLSDPSTQWEGMLAAIEFLYA